MFKNNFKIRADIVFVAIIAIGLGILGSALLLGFRIYEDLFLIQKTNILSSLETVCGCTKHLDFAHHPLIFSFLGISGAGLVIFFCFAVWRSFKIKNSTNNFVRSIIARRKQELSPKLQRAAHLAALDNSVVEIDSDMPLVFCFGFLKPRICVSSLLVKNLQKIELVAVLTHERKHLVDREPFKQFVIKILSNTLFFIPLLKDLSLQYLALSELAADREATNDFKDKAPLTRALYKTMRMKEVFAIKNNLAVSFFTPTAERVNKLMDNDYEPHYRIFNFRLLISIIFIIFSFAMVGFADSSTTEVLQSGTSICPVKELSTEKTCQSLDKKVKCEMGYSLNDPACE